MRLENSSKGHFHRKIYSVNPLLGEKLIFVEVGIDLQDQIRSLKMELEILEQDLKDPRNFARFDEIREKIEKTKEEIKDLEGAESEAPDNVPLLMNGLQNNIDEINTFLASEKDFRKRKRLEEDKIACNEALKARKKPVTNLAELNEAVDQIKSDQRLINSIKNKKVDEVDLDLFLKSGMLPFVDIRFKHAIKNARERMLTNDDVQNTLGRTPELTFEEADRRWNEFKKETEEDIELLKQERSKVLGRMKKAKLEEKPQLQRMLKDLDDTIRYFQAQLKDGYDDWTHRERTRKEAESASKSVLESVSPDTLEKLKNLLIEAQGMRAERVRDYLASEMETLEKQFADLKAQRILDETMADRMEARLKDMKNIIVSQRISDPEELRNVAKDFEAEKLSLSETAKEVRNNTENRTQLESSITSEYARYQQAKTILTPERIEQIKTEYRARKEAEGFAADSPTITKELAGYDILEGKDVIIKAGEETVSARQIIDQVENDVSDLSKLSDEEVAQLSRDLKTLNASIHVTENYEKNLEKALSPENRDAEKAHKAIAEIMKFATDADDIESVLEKYLGVERLQNHRDKKAKRINGDPNKHVKVIPSSEFEGNYRGHTKKGKMVFYEKGEEWYILIDETALKDKKEFENLRKQVVHELLHVEFERHEETRKRAKAIYIDSNPERWKKIKAAFIVMARARNKKPPHGDTWEDDDILSELFAMQHEVGRNWSDKKTPEDMRELNDLLVGLGTATAFGKEMKEKEQSYKKEAEEEIHGYEEGMEDGVKPDEEGKLSINKIGDAPEKAAHTGYKKEIKDIDGRLEELNKSPYLGKVSGAGELVSAMSKYNKGTNNLNEKLLKNPESEILSTAIQSRIDKVKGDVTDLEDKLGKAARKAPNNEINFLQKIWINTTFLCVEDFVKLGKDTYEFLSRRHQRRVADHAAKLGMALFSGTDLGREARARQQKAELEEVNEWKSRYENLDAWQLMDELRGLARDMSPSQDQLKAILRILADKGRINWRDENLWIVLNKLQSTTELRPGDQLLLHNPVLLRQRLRTALGNIYDFDEFENLERTNESSYQSEKGKYDTAHSRMQDKLNDRLDELLGQHRAGEQVDPILYESIMEYAIKNGKCYAENVMFHLISGMAEGLLAADRGLALGDHLNTWPAVDWFSSFDPPMSQADWKRLCLTYFPDDFKSASITREGCGAQFKNYYWTTIQNNQKVVERVKKSVGERSWDHDWGRSIACMGDADTAKRFLAGRSGQQETKSTAVGNAYVGAIQWLEENALNPRFASKENFARMAGWLAMSEGILYGTAYNRKENDISTRQNEAMNSDVPREAGVGRYGKKNLRFHRDLAEQFLMQIDPEFFGMLSGRECRSDDQKKEIGAAVRDYLIGRYPSLAEELADVEVIDQIYNNLDLIIKTMFDAMSPADFQRILIGIAARAK